MDYLMNIPQSLSFLRNGYINLSTFQSSRLKGCPLSSVAQLDARPTGDQTVVGSTLAGTATFFHGD